MDALPASAALSAALAGELRRTVQASGGDDYEVCFTATPARRDAVAAIARDVGVPVARIGRIVAGQGVAARAGESAWAPDATGYRHFNG